MMRLVLALAGVLCLSGCLLAAIGGAAVPRTGDGNQYPRRIRAPLADRCASQALELLREDCRQAREEAAQYVRRLSVDDQVCLDGNPIAQGVTPRCRVRAFVEDVSTREVKLEIREAPSASGFKLMEDYWFEEAALVDLGLEAAGFSAPEPAAAQTPAQ